MVGIADKLKGQIPVGFICLKAGVNRDPGEVEAECVKLVREKIGAVAALRIVMNVPTSAEDPVRQGSCGERSARLPMARTGTCRQRLTILAILDEITEALSERRLVGA